MIKTDCHNHSKYSPDSRAEVAEIALYAEKYGLSHVIVTDHIDFNHYTEIWRTPPDHDGLRRDIASAAEIFPSVKISAGVEIGMGYSKKTEIAELVKKSRVEFVIGSIHDLENMYFGDDFYNTRTKKEAYRQYFEYALKTIKAVDDFDVFGHFDIVARYARCADKTLDPDDYADVIDEIIKTLVEKGKGVEINTAGPAFGLSHLHPHPAILRRFKELGGEIVTVGSDAHTPSDLARNFDWAERALADAGFDYYCDFNDRKPTFIKL